MEYAAFSNNINQNQDEIDMSLLSNNYINEPINIDYNNLTIDSICSPSITNEYQRPSNKIMKIKDEIFQIISNNDELLDDNETKEIPKSYNEIDNLVNELQKKISEFHKLQNETIKLENEFKNELTKTKEDLDVLDGMVKFISTLNNEMLNSDTMKGLIKNMEDISENMKQKKSIIDVKKKYIEKRKEIQKYIYFIGKLNQWNQTNLCALCMVKQVDSYCNPCGHTLCKECFNNTEEQQIDNIKSCPFCRKNIFKISPLYFL
tara:strand:+ start:300 stop:1085 length:786 start_codon:yes stop_codon:yes gene_type:complete